ncbi:FKBP-type peptidyl-prolyl cis-trans isomerase [Aureispira sp. CCB-E]|uniref:FKBP-type peptidyl-prolyl cis-trans isomerase n=1 Tax=Aureispira sp. CCB-E TaxID=3051121 RepID=UPI00286916B2|nr:FKBP-type peptidyl-prolyl cis-trans isomerase [Aureispira sp. CCB-E]WMX12824.1 FKBP-type peptidyl-prolyl cis-trans isomerase [Aureispira sp. CCB-E]
MSEKMEAFKRKLAAKRKAQNEAFLAENAQKETVTVLDNGIQYEVLEEGFGKVSPSVKDWVTVHYHGALIDGKVFDSSVDRKKTATFKLNNLIQAWQEVVPLMVAGDKWRLVVPPSMGYGDRQEGKIPSNSILIFELELIAIGK